MDVKVTSRSRWGGPLELDSTYEVTAAAAYIGFGVGYITLTPTVMRSSLTRSEGICHTFNDNMCSIQGSAFH